MSAITNLIRIFTGYEMPPPICEVTLNQVREARGNINEIRLLLKGNKEMCLRLFKEAVAADDAIAQIEMAYAYYGIKWGNDEGRDFSSLTVFDLKEFDYYPREFALFNDVYKEAIGEIADWEAREKKAMRVFTKAADLGYLPAILTLKVKEWERNLGSYGFAVELKPFVDKGDKQLDFYFGYALRNGCKIGSTGYYEGLYWIWQSSKMEVKTPISVSSYSTHSSLHHSNDGFDYVGGKLVLAPSREMWDHFVQEKLMKVEIASPDSYLFPYDVEEIKSLINRYQISFACPWNHMLSVHFDNLKIGTISVREGKICETMEDPRIRPLIVFIENVMVRSGSAHSAYSWLRQMGEFSLSSRKYAWIRTIAD